MIVSFVGGPLHGRHEYRQDVPDRIVVEDLEGRYVYEMRQQSGGAAVTDIIRWTHSTYALEGMPLDEFFRLSRDVYPPLSIKDISNR